MSDGTVLRELTKSLSEKERKELLDKISKSISLTEDSDSSIYPKEMNDEERDVLITHDMQTASFMTRFFLWLKNLLGNKSKKEIFLSLKLNSLRSTIQRKNPGLTGFETRDLTPKTAQEFFNLYVLVYPLIPIFRKMWKNPEGFENSLMKLIERRIPDSKKNLFDLVSQKEMEQIYSDTGTKERIREIVIKKIEDYIGTIPEDVFYNLEKQIKPIYYLKDIALFPYNSFFSLFHFSPKPTDEKPIFKSANATLALDYLEKMFYAVYTTSKIDLPIETETTFAADILNSTLDDGREEGAEEDNESTSSVDNSSIDNGELLIKAIDRVVKAIPKFSRAVPLVELIRYFKADPYYQLIFYIPKLMVRDFYHSFLKIHLLPEFDKVFPEIRKNVIEQKINDLFQGKRLISFLHYRDYTSIDIAALGLPKFKHTRSIHLLYNYIRLYYRKTIQETIQILSRGLLKQNRITLNRLLLHAAAVEDLEEKIQQFELSLSPDEEDGKLFQRIRHSLSSDLTHQRLYRNLISQKDKEAESFIQKGKESFLGIKKIFDELLSSPMESMKEKLDILHTIGGKAVTLKTLLLSQAEHLEKFNRLLHQLSRIELGS